MRGIIVGGGIAGLTTSIALRRVGIESAIFERQEEQSKLQVGSGLSVWNNAMRLLSKLDLAEGVKSIGAEIDLVEHRTWRGELLATWPVGELNDMIGVPTMCVVRAELHSVISDAVEAGTLHLGKNATGFSQDRAGVTVTFTDGSEERADFLIGADGIHSNLRSQHLGQDEPRYAGYVVFQGITRLEHPAAPVGLFALNWGPGQRFNYEHVGGDNRLYWSAVIRTSAEEQADSATRKERLLDTYADWQPPVQEAIAATDQEVITRLPIHGRKPVRHWGAGRMTLAGDAAHPMTFNLGQGAGMGIEDAVTLARCLDGADDVPTALRAYEDERRRRTAIMMRLSWAIGAAGKWSSPRACAVRERGMRKFYRGQAWRRHALDMSYEPGSKVDMRQFRRDLPKAR